jgi:hypothetical protein
VLECAVQLVRSATVYASLLGEHDTEQVRSEDEGMFALRAPFVAVRRDRHVEPCAGHRAPADRFMEPFAHSITPHNVTSCDSETTVPNRGSPRTAERSNPTQSPSRQRNRRPTGHTPSCYRHSEPNGGVGGFPITIRLRMTICGAHGRFKLES